MKDGGIAGSGDWCVLLCVWMVGKDSFGVFGKDCWENMKSFCDGGAISNA